MLPVWGFRPGARGVAMPRHREPRAPSTSIGPPESPGPKHGGSRLRSRGQTGSGHRWGRREALTVPGIACGSPPTRPLARRIARAISMGHYQRDLALRYPVTAAHGRRPRPSDPASNRSAGSQAGLPSPTCPPYNSGRRARSSGFAQAGRVRPPRRWLGRFRSAARWPNRWRPCRSLRAPRSRRHRTRWSRPGRRPRLRR